MKYACLLPSLLLIAGCTHDPSPTWYLQSLGYTNIELKPTSGDYCHEPSSVGTPYLAKDRDGHIVSGIVCYVPAKGHYINPDH